MRTVLLSLATAAAAVVATPAFAAAAPGPYVGVGVTDDNVNGTGNAEGFGISGVGGTAFAGYNFSLGDHAFAGVETNFDLGSASDGSTKFDHSYGASGRIGYRLSPGAALYGRAGYERGRMTFDRGLSTEYHESRDGLRLGGGLEANIVGNTAVRLEYDHTHYYRSASDPVDTGIANNQVTAGLVFGF